MAGVGAPLGNQYATLHRRVLSTTMARLLNGNPDRARKIAELIIQRASDPDDPQQLQAATLLLDRLEGKAVQSLSLDGADGPINVQAIVIRTVEPQNVIDAEVVAPTLPKPDLP